MATLAVTDETFDSEVKNSDIPVVVDFWAERCGPCKQIGPSLEELSAEMDGKVKIVKVNVDENPNSPAQMGVRGIPALFIFKDGQVVSNMAGAKPKAALQSWTPALVRPKAPRHIEQHDKGDPHGARRFPRLARDHDHRGEKSR